MAKAFELPKSPPSRRISDHRDIGNNLQYARNVVIGKVNDTNYRNFFSNGTPFYARKVGGSSIVYDFSTVGAPTAPSIGYEIMEFFGIGGFDKNKITQHIAAYSDNKIYIGINGTEYELYDVSSDGYSISFMTVVVRGTYAYISIGDSTMDEKLYLYDPLAGGAPTLTLIDQTGLNACGVLGSMPDRLVSIGTANATTVQYSKLKTSGDFRENEPVPVDSFTADTTVSSAGELSGVNRAAVGLIEYRSNVFVASRSNITVHALKPPIYSGGSGASDLSKDPDTIKEAFTIDKGINNPKSICTGRDYLYFVDEQSGVFQYDLTTQRLVSLTKGIWDDLSFEFFFNESSICVDSSRNRLYVTAKRSVGGAESVVLIYNFDSKAWSFAEKYVSHIHYSVNEKKVYGIASDRSAVFEIFDDSFSERGNDIEVEVVTFALDGGNRKYAIEMDHLSFMVGHTNASDSMDVEILADGATNPLYEETVDLSERSGKKIVDLTDSFGLNVLSAERAGGEFAKLFKSYYDEPLVDDVNYVQIRVKEKSTSDFLIGFMDVNVILSDDEIDDY